VTPEQAATLRHFAWSELHHPEGMDFDFMRFLDDVREEYGWPLVITSDFRTPEENAASPGSSPTSRHLVGQAVDLEFPPTSNHLWLLVEAVVAMQRGPAVELELVPPGAPHAHVHLAWLKLGQAPSMFVTIK
jgi:uncharacterized protein YcbK (DUF882 family)